MITKKTALLFLLLLSVLETNAQTKQATKQALYWTRYYNQLQFSEKWTWHNEFDERRFFENNRHQQFVVHTRLHYKFFKNTDVALGFCYSLQSPQTPNSTSDLVIPELRPYEEINYSSLITKRLTLQHRIRIDERFVHKNNNKELINGYDFNFRFRYRIQATYKLNKDESKKATTLKIADEFMMNAGKNIVYNQFDQNRIYVAVEQTINKHFSAELGYMYLYQQRASGYQFYDRDIIRFTLYHKMKL